VTSAPTEEHLPDDTAERHPGVGGFDRLRLLLAVAMGTVLVSYAMLVPSAAAALLTGGVGMSLDGAFGAAVPLWLAAHHIPLVLEGRPLSVLPMLPIAGVLLVAATGASWAVGRLGGRARSDAGAVVAAIAGAHAAVAVLGSALLPAAAELAVAPWSAMVGGGLVAGLGAGAGVLRRCGLPVDVAERIPGWARHGLVAGGVAVAGLVAVGAAVLAVGVVLRAEPVTASFAELAPDGGPAVGVALLTLAYLPNAVVGALGWVLGPGVTVGVGTTTPFILVPGEPPAFPLLAVLPDTAPGPWTGLVLLLPVAVGVLAGLRCHRAGPGERLPATLTAIAVAALAAAVLAGLAGGRLAAGPYDPVRVPAGLVGVSVLLLVGIPALLVYLFRIGAGERAPAADPVPTVGDDADDEDLPADPAERVPAGRAAVERASSDPAGDEPADGDAADRDPAGRGSAGPAERVVERASAVERARLRRARRAAKGPGERTPQEERAARAAERAARAARRKKSDPEAVDADVLDADVLDPDVLDADVPDAEFLGAEAAAPEVAEPERPEPDLAEPGAAEPDAAAEPPRPRTVGELVALRAQQAAAKRPPADPTA
jgi:hypothetical protein